MILEGHATETFVTYDYSELISFCVARKKEGYFLYKAKAKIQWPFFWVKKYKVIFRRNFICDPSSKEFEFLPQNISL